MINDGNIKDILDLISSKSNVFAILENPYENEISISCCVKSYFNSNDKNFEDYLDKFSKRSEDVIGYISYDSIKLWEKVKNLNKIDEKWPFAEFFVPEYQIKIKNEKSLYNKIINYIEELETKTEKLKIKQYDQFLNKQEYENKVREILDYIYSGYAFQVVLSRSYRYEFKGDPLSLYLKLRRISPSPYLFYMKFYNRALIGSSPELLFEIDNNNIKTYPIAGTRPRGKSNDEDLALEKELLTSTKDRAEHLMLLDLARNDIGKVSIPGSVKVTRSFYIEKYSHVQHLVSEVIGKLDKRRGLKDVIKAMFPAGTVTGAPKPFAMNLIEELEPIHRGPYAGIVGYFNKNKAIFAIAIRTSFINNDILRIQAGAGIVYDSIPELEFFETEDKLRALKLALGDK